MGLMKRLLETRTVRKQGLNVSHEGPFDVSIEEQGITDRHMRSLDTEAMNQFNASVKQWTDTVRADLGVSVSSSGIKGSKLRKGIRNNFRYDFGEIYRIGFTFPREGVFVHKGVGKGYVMNSGVVVKTSKTIGFNRQPKPWFNPVLTRHLPALGEIIQAYTKRAIINSSRIYIR